MKLVKKFLAPEEKEGGAEKVTKPTEETTNVELAKALKDLKEQSVSREEYEKLKKENKDLIDQVINGGGASGSDQGTPSPKSKADYETDIVRLRQELYGPKGKDLNNLEVMTKVIELRDANLAVGNEDPFLSTGNNIKPADREREKERAEAVANTIKECIAEAQGDSGVFTAVLQTKIANDPIALTNHFKKIGIK